MCTYVNKDVQLQVATKNIKCYKILLIDPKNSRRFIAPVFMSFLWFDARTSKKEIKKTSEIGINVSMCYSTKNVINKGLHSCISLINAKSLLTELYKNTSDIIVKYKIFEAYIPKGALYASGIHDANYGDETEYASDILIIKK